jgi:glutathione S-transferase
MELYTAGTGNGQRAAIAVNECGVQCTMHVLNLAQGDQKKPDYLKINPTARIPTLIDPDGPGGYPLTLIQSWAILYYLAEKTGRLIPSDPLARARTYQWLGEAASDMAPTAQKPGRLAEPVMGVHKRHREDLAYRQLSRRPPLLGFPALRSRRHRGVAPQCDGPCSGMGHQSVGARTR